MSNVWIEKARCEAARRYRHGTRARYVLGKCRCAPCTNANRQYIRATSDAKKQPYKLNYSPSGRRWAIRNRDTGEIVFRAPKAQKPKALKELAKRNAGQNTALDAAGGVLMTRDIARRKYPHGTNARYHLGKCRCRPCRDAAIDYAQRRVHDPDLPLIPVDDCVKHIRFLQAQGMGVKAIARAAGMAQSSLSRFVNDYRRTTKTRPSTAAKILNVTFTPSDGMRMRSNGSIVLIERLVSAGYKRNWIAQAIGLKQDRHLPLGKSAYVKVGNARKLHALYVRLSRKDHRLPPIDPTFAASEMEPTSLRSGRRWKSGDLTLPVEVAKQVHPHGTQTRYQILGCRCKRCVAAHAELTKAVRERNTSPFILRKLGARRYAVRNRTTATIVFRSTRRTAAASVCAQLNAADPFYGAKHLSDATDVISHLHALIAAGVSIVAIVKASGVNYTTVQGLVEGRLRRTTAIKAQKLLVVTDAASTPSERVDAAPIHRMLRRLQSVGFESRWMAELLGFPIDELLHSKRPTMHLWRARAVMQLYAQLHDRIILLRSLANIEERNAA